MNNNFTMDYDVPDLKQKLQPFRTLPAENIIELASKVYFDSDDCQFPEEYLRSLYHAGRIICLRDCLICWSMPCRQIPREMQLRAVLADHHRRVIL